MKKLFAILFMLLCALVLFSACNQDGTTEAPPTGDDPNATPPAACQTHTWGEWQTVIPATCGIGKEERVCNICGAKELHDLPSTGAHTIVNDECSVCHRQVTKGLSYKLVNYGTAYAVESIGSATDTDILIPNVYNGKPVISIVSGAFAECTLITSVDLPTSIEYIGQYAFFGCKNLKTVSIPATSKLTSIQIAAFSSCVALENLTIPASVTKIGEVAFNNCPSLTNLSISGANTKYSMSGKCLIEIASGALLRGCSDSVIPTDGSVTSIATGAFSGCDKLVTVHIPSSVTKIYNGAFYNCTALSEVTFAENIQLEEFNGSMFEGCTSLETIEIPASVKRIPDAMTVTDMPWTKPFQKMPALKRVIVEEGNTTFFVSGNCLIEKNSGTLLWACNDSVIPTDGSVCTIASNAFVNCTELVSIQIPASVTQIGYRAFFGCTKLADVSFANGSQLTRLDGNVFENCTALETFRIPASVTHIELASRDSVFYGCTALKSVLVEEGNTAYHSAGNCLIATESGTLLYAFNDSVIPTDGSVTVIGENAFDNCSNLERLTIPASVTSILSGGFSFWTCTDLVLTVESGNPVYHSAGNCLIETNAKKLLWCGKDAVIPADGTVVDITDASFICTEITIPAAITTCEWGIFSEFLKNVTFAEDCQLTEIHFEQCFSLETVNFAASLKRFNFRRCASLLNVNFAPGTAFTVIAEGAFEGCESLESIALPAGVETIESDAFYQCSNLKKIVIPASVQNIAKDAFGVLPLAEIVLDAGNTSYHMAGNCLIETATKTLLRGFSDSVIPTDGSVTTIADYAFYGCTALASVHIPAAVTYIGSAFGGCSSLASVTFEAGSAALELNGTFMNCNALISIQIPARVNLLDRAFRSCRSLASVTFEAGSVLTEIGYWTFGGCSALESIIIPASVTTIGDSTFRECEKLKSVVFENGSRLSCINRDAFFGCPLLAEICLPETVTVIDSAFGQTLVMAQMPYEPMRDFDMNTVEEMFNPELDCFLNCIYVYDGSNEAPTLNYRFSGWYIDAALTIPFDFDSWRIEANRVVGDKITLYTKLAVLNLGFPLLPMRIEKTAFETKIMQPLQEACEAGELSMHDYMRFMAYYSLKRQGGPGVAEAYPVTAEKGIDIYVYNDIANIKTLRRLEAILAYADYTFEELEKDHAFVEYFSYED